MSMLQETLNTRTEQLRPHFKPGFLQRDNTVFQFNFDTGEQFYLNVRPRDFEFVAGQSPSPTLTLTMSDHRLCWRLLTGQQNGMESFMAGHYRADGNIVLSQLILYLFKPDDPTLIYEVMD